MLKSTHRSSSLQANGEPQALPDGWTEHKAPTGHSYYYNAATQQSTYTRPSVPVAPVEPERPLNGSTWVAPSAPLTDPSQSFLQYSAVRNVGPSAGTTFDNGDYTSTAGRGGFSGHREGRGNHDASRSRRSQPTDKPRSKQEIPGCSPWILVNTKLGRRFVYNPEKGQSYWRIPDKLKGGILEIDQQRIREKAGKKDDIVPNTTRDIHDAGAVPGPAPRPRLASDDNRLDGEDSSEYEEVEVTDDEDEDEASVSKRQRTDEAQPEQPVEFNEDDIAFQLAAMGQDYGLDPDEYDDGNLEEWAEDIGDAALSAADSSALFQDLLNDSGINPYSPWDKIVEDGKLVDDTRYTALTSMKARKDAWEEWSRNRIKILKEQRAQEEKKDPRVPYLVFLQNHATPKLYWPEFKRRYRKEPEMRDNALSDKDREKYYRDYISRKKLPQSTCKTDFLDLLKSQPLSRLNNSTLSSHLHPAILADLRYVSVDPAIREALLEAYISTLPAAPEGPEADDAEAIQARVDRVRRENALQERERQVAEQKRQQKRNLEHGRDRLRQEEAEVANAMTVSKKGLKEHLFAGETTSS